MPPSTSPDLCSFWMKEHHQFTLLPWRCGTERRMTLTEFWNQAEAKRKCTEWWALGTAWNTAMALRKSLKVFKQKTTENVCKTLLSTAVFAVTLCDGTQEGSNRCFLSGSSDINSFHLDANRSSISACAIKQKKIHKYWLQLASVAPFLRVSHQIWLLRLQDRPRSWITSRALSQAVWFSRIRSGVQLLCAY